MLSGKHREVSMTKDERIIELSVQARAALEELEEAIATAKPDAQKEAIADRFNKISDEIYRLGGWDANRT